jgi:hypothetical protein
LKDAAEVSLQFAELSEAVRVMTVMPFAQLSEAARAAAVIPLAQFSEALRITLPPMLIGNQYAELGRQLRLITAGPWPVYADQMTLASAAGLAQLAASWNVIANADVLARPTLTGDAEVVKAPEKPEVAPQGVGTDPARKVNVAAFAVVLIWACALTMPAAQALLSPEAQGMINSYAGFVALALIITWRINDNHKR